MKPFKNLALIFLGLFLAEGGLQVLSLVTRAKHISQPQVEVKNKKVILCLGESTTALGGKDSYPSQLQKILNEKKPDQYNVINLGSPNYHSDEILRRLPNWIEKYQPNIVISMMGINDFWNTSPSQHLISHSLRKIRILKLIDMAYINFKYSGRPEPPKLEEKNYGPFIQTPKEPSDAIKIEDGVKLAKNKKWFPALNHLNRVIQNADNKVGVAAQIWNQFENPHDPELVEFLTFLMDDNKISLIARAHKESIFGMIALKKEKPDVAVRHFAKAYQLGLINPHLIVHYANALHQVGMHDKAITILLDNVDICQGDKDRNCFQALLLYLVQAKRFNEAKGILKIAVDTFPHLNVFKYARKFPIEEYLDRVNDSPEKMFSNPKLVDNYRKLVTQLKEKGIRSVAVQYPTLSVRPLGLAIGDLHPDRIVNNRQNFLEAIASEGHERLFVDRFAQSFGHFTPLGARLLALNIYEAYFSH